MFTIHFIKHGGLIKMNFVPKQSVRGDTRKLNDTRLIALINGLINLSCLLSTATSVSRTLVGVRNRIYGENKAQHIPFSLPGS